MSHSADVSGSAEDPRALEARLTNMLAALRAQERVARRARGHEEAVERLGRQVARLGRDTELGAALAAELDHEQAQRSEALQALDRLDGPVAFDDLGAGLQELVARATWVRTRAAMHLDLDVVVAMEKAADAQATARIEGDDDDGLAALDDDAAEAPNEEVTAMNDLRQLLEQAEADLNDDALAVDSRLGAALGLDDEEGDDEATQLADLQALLEAAEESLAAEQAGDGEGEADDELLVEFEADEAEPEPTLDPASYVVDDASSRPSYLDDDDDVPDYLAPAADDDPATSYVTMDPEPASRPAPDVPSYLVEETKPAGDSSGYVIGAGLADDEEPAPSTGNALSDGFVLQLGTEETFDDEEPTRLHDAKRLREQLEDEAIDDDPSFSDVGDDALASEDDALDGLIEESLDGDEVELDIEEVEPEAVESFDLMPDLEGDEEITLVSGLEEETEIPAAEEPASGRGAPRVATAAPRVAPSPRAAAAAGLYGAGAVPTIREGSEPAPKAAAVQLNSQGAGGRMLGLEEEAEPIAVGSADDYGEEEEEYYGDGLSIHTQEYEDEEEEEDEELELELELEEPEPAPAPPPPPPGPTAGEIQAAYAKAKEAAESGQLQEAADLFSDVIDLDPDHMDAHVGRGRLYLDLGDYSRAMSDFMVAEEIDEQSPEPQVAIGDLYFHRKDYRKAIEYFDAALQMSPNHAMAHCRRGISHYYRKNYRDAVTDLERANQLDADIPNISSFISMAKRKAKKK